MKNHDRIHTRKPECIEVRKNFIIGGEIAGLATTAFLIEDGQMAAFDINLMLAGLNLIPKMPGYYPEQEENKKIKEIKL